MKLKALLYKKVLIHFLLLFVLLLVSCSKEENNNLGGGQQGNMELTQPPKVSMRPQPTKEPIVTKPPVATNNPITPKITQPQNPTLLAKQVMKMSLDEKIGQLVIVGIEGYSMDDHARALIKDYHVGGIILFGRNVESSKQLLELNNELKEFNSMNAIPLFLSVDEEGGRVSRMPEEIKKLPTNKIIGEVNDLEFSYSLGRLIARETKSFGFNMNFAPVLDINSNPENPVIGDRSFGSEVKIVSELGIQTMLGMKDNGMISVVKHFPGHGDTLVDSHIGLPYVKHSMERLRSFELIPFQEAIDNDVDAVMIAHILLSKIDAQNPASLSSVIITDLLRYELGFRGVVLTDDITMGAIVENYEIGEAAIKAIHAGSDIILACHGFDNEIKVIQSLKQAVLDGTITEDRINESVYRVLLLKDKYKLSDETISDMDYENINQEIDEVLSKYMKSD